jgi:protein-tyrosine-phosphatase
MCATDDVALKSRYVTKRHDVPRYQPGDDSWVDAMDTVVAGTRFQLVIPCDDQGVIPLQVCQKRLGRQCKLYVLGDQAFEIAFSKIKSAGLADRLGIPQPKTAVLRAGDDCESISEFSLPVVIKPPSSFTSDDLASKRGVVRCRTKEQLSREFSKLQEWGGAIVQENFLGTGVGVELLAQDGKVLVAFQHVRVHEPLEGGGSSYRRSAHLNPELLAASKLMMRELDYTGVAMVEFKFNFDTGQWVFIEINGRFWGSLPLAIAAGVDFPLYLYELLVHGRREFSQRYRVPVFCRNISSDQRWLRSNLSADKSDPLLATRPLLSVAMEPLNLLLLRERWDTLTIDDPAPGLADAARIVQDAASTIARTCYTTLNESYPIRRWRRSQVLAKARTAESILFICKGNICRSPFAERYALRTLPAEITVRSCGYYPVNGRPSPDVARDVGGRFGVDLSSHRSQIINEELVRDADLIFTFDDQNRETVISRFPFAAGRAFGLGLLGSWSPSGVADPYGGSESGFEGAYTHIAEAIDNLAASLRRDSEPVANARPELGGDST